MVPMSIQDPKAISVSGSVADLLAQVDETLSELNKRRPFPVQTEGRLRRRFLPDRITATLNIEGIGVTRRETLAIMEAMTISSNASREEREILNALHADSFIYEAVDNKIGVDPSLVRRVNELILDGVHGEAGIFRNSDVEISGAAFTPPSHVDIPSLIQGMCDGFPASGFIHPIMQAAWLHNQFTYIHPFLDGNGRTARLLQDYCLLNRGLYPVGIPTKRDDYYSAL
jgi:Fic family protein